MEETVEGSGGHDGVTGEDVAPFGEGFVGGDDGGGLFFVAAADDLEEQRGLFVVESEIADLVHDEQLGRRQHFQVVRHAVLCEGGLHPPGQLEGREEKQTLAAFGAAESQGDGEVRLADAGQVSAKIPGFPQGRCEYTIDGILGMGNRCRS